MINWFNFECILSSFIFVKRLRIVSNVILWFLRKHHTHMNSDTLPMNMYTDAFNHPTRDKSAQYFMISMTLSFVHEIAIIEQMIKKKKKKHARTTHISHYAQ